MELEVVELLDDFFARLAREQVGMLDDGSVDLLEAEAARDLAEMVEEPATAAQIFGVEVAGPSRGLELEARHAESVPQTRRLRDPSRRSCYIPLAEEVLMKRCRALALFALPAWLAACGGEEKPAAPAAPEGAAAAAETPASLPQGLLVALSQFPVGPDGKAAAKPGPARLEWVEREDGRWKTGAVEDPESNVFHKALVFAPPGQPPAILTLGGNAAALQLWRLRDGALVAQPIWKAEFGGKQNRMRDAEVGDILGDGTPAIAVATHDQGVVALVTTKSDGGFDVRELDREADTFVHEIELGDLDGDGVLEIYATPSEPNKLDGTPQPGKVVRYVPKRDEGRRVVADLGERHAKEILVRDVDGNGRDELYVCVEAVTEGKDPNVRITKPVEVRRYEASTEPAGGTVVATLDDRLCRFLTAGDVDGDGKRELVAAGFRSGVWLLRPGADASQPWKKERLDANSSGFEHAVLLVDLDRDGKDELYVASDDQGELRRWTWKDGKASRETILSRKVPGSVMTWNLMPVPVEMLPDATATPAGN